MSLLDEVGEGGLEEEGLDLLGDRLPGVVGGAGIGLGALPLAHEAAGTDPDPVEGIDDVEEGDLGRGAGEGEPPPMPREELTIPVRDRACRVFDR